MNSRMSTARELGAQVTHYVVMQTFQHRKMQVPEQRKRFHRAASIFTVSYLRDEEGL